MKNHHYVIILLACSMLIFFFGLGNMALTDPDETFYAQTAKEMLKAGEWVTPVIFGSPQFEKPVLYYILVMFSYMLFGVGEFAARFPSAVLGIAGVIGVYFLGRLLFSPLCGFLSGLVLATCIGYIGLARACVTDMALTVFILYCLFFFLKGWASGSRVYYFTSSLMAALAVLTKGPIGLFIPCAIIAVYIILSRQGKDLAKVPVGWSLLIFLIVSLPWYLTVINMHGDTFIGEFFRFQNITRFIRSEHRISGMFAIFFYIPVIIGGFFPWSFFLPLGIANVYRYRDAAAPVKSRDRFLLAWFLVVFLFFTVARTKVVTYIFPFFPALAVMVGSFWEEFLLTGRWNEKIYKGVKYSFLAFVGISYCAMAVVNFVIGARYPQALTGLIRSEVILFVGFMAAMVLFFRNRRVLSFSAIVCTVMLTVIPMAVHVLPEVGKVESTKAAALEVKKLMAPGDPLGGESDYRRGIAFYTDRTDIVDIHSSADPDKFLSMDGPFWGIVRVKHYDEFKEKPIGERIRLVFRSGKHVLFTSHE